MDDRRDRHDYRDDPNYPTPIHGRGDRDDRASNSGAFNFDDQQEGFDYGGDNELFDDYDDYDLPRKGQSASKTGGVCKS